MHKTFFDYGDMPSLYTNEELEQETPPDLSALSTIERQTDQTERPPRDP
jgi:hypothetical protein